MNKNKQKAIEKEYNNLEPIDKMDNAQIST